MNSCIIAYDIGTTGIKTCAFELTDRLSLIAGETESYGLIVAGKGYAEQNPQEWWRAMCTTTKRLLQKNNINPTCIKGISFCAQMQGLVLVDKSGIPVRNAISYMDNRGGAELAQVMGSGIKIAGINICKLLQSLWITGAVAASVKDPVWKYRWVRKHEPELFKHVYKWLDVKEYLIYRCTEEFVMTEDSAFATLLYDTRKGKRGFSETMCKMMGVNQDHLPRVVKSTDIVGALTNKAAEELGLKVGTSVFGGGGDASLIGVGAGAVESGSTHVYLGTSGWVSTVVERKKIDLKHMIASIVGADSDKFNYFAELETAGKCLEWVRDHLALDEIGVYLTKEKVRGSEETVSISLYDYMMEAIRDVPPGSGGVIFTPWLNGNRSPFEDPRARGMFFNIGLETGKTELIHSVLEGVCYHIRWQLEAQQSKVSTSKNIRLVGGGALASLTCQMLADTLGLTIETVENPQNAGAVGAAAIAAAGLSGSSGIKQAATLVKVVGTYQPDLEKHAEYNKYFKVFKTLYTNNKKAFASLNG